MKIIFSKCLAFPSLQRRKRQTFVLNDLAGGCSDEGADAHCQAGAQRLALARVCNWLDDTPRHH